MSTAIFFKMNPSLWGGKTLRFCKDRKNCLNPKTYLMKSFVARVFLVILFLISNEINNMKTGKCFEVVLSVIVFSISVNTFNFKISAETS